MDKREFDNVREELMTSSLVADMAQEFPSSYSVDEVLRITARLDCASEEAERLMREDFATLPPLAQERMIGLLSEHSEQSRRWWHDLLHRKD